MKCLSHRCNVDCAVAFYWFYSACSTTIRASANNLALAQFADKCARMQPQQLFRKIDSLRGNKGYCHIDTSDAIAFRSHLSPSAPTSAPTSGFRRRLLDRHEASGSHWTVTRRLFSSNYCPAHSFNAELDSASKVCTASLLLCAEASLFDLPAQIHSLL